MVGKHGKYVYQTKGLAYKDKSVESSNHFLIRGALEIYIIFQVHLVSNI